MADSPTIIIPRIHQSGSGLDPLDVAAEEAARMDKIPLRILCPECCKVYTLYIKDLNQGLYCLLGQACPYCKRFIRETDDPEKLLVDLKDIRESMRKNKEA
jgi:hypothetical protein